MFCDPTGIFRFHLRFSMQYLIPWFGNLWIKRIIVIIRKMKQGRIFEDLFLWHIFQASFSITTKKEIPTDIYTIINDSIYRFPTASGIFVTDKSNTIVEWFNDFNHSSNEFL